MAVFSVSRVESQIVSRFIFVLVRVNSWIVSAQKNTIHETTRNNTKRYEITPNDEAIVGMPNLDSKLGHYRNSENVLPSRASLSCLRFVEQTNHNVRLLT